MTAGTADDTPYTVRSIQEMLGLSRGVISGLIASGFVTPRRGARNEYRFSFRDVVLLRTAVDLQAARIAPRKIVGALRKLQATLPAELPLTGLRISAVGNDVTVRDGGSQWQAESGQLVIDFDVAPQKGSVSFLQHRPGRRATPMHAGADADAVADAHAHAVADAAEDAQAAAATWFARGEALEASDPDASEAAYRRALAIDPGHADASLNLGALLCEARRCDEAVALYDAAVRLHPDEALLHFNRAVALEDQGRQADALASYEASLRLSPDLADAHYNAGRLHEKLGDARNAVRHFSAYRRLQR